jgi:hypothetical protein
MFETKAYFAELTERIIFHGCDNKMTFKTVTSSDEHHSA